MTYDKLVEWVQDHYDDSENFGKTPEELVENFDNLSFETQADIENIIQKRLDEYFQRSAGMFFGIGDVVITSRSERRYVSFMDWDLELPDVTRAARELDRNLVVLESSPGHYHILALDLVDHAGRERWRAYWSSKGPTDYNMEERISILRLTAKNGYRPKYHSSVFLRGMTSSSWHLCYLRTVIPVDILKTLYPVTERTYFGFFKGYESDPNGAFERSRAMIRGETAYRSPLLEGEVHL